MWEQGTLRAEPLTKQADTLLSPRNMELDAIRGSSLSLIPVKPTDNTTWLLSFEETRKKSFTYQFTHTQHHDAWLQLIETTHLTDSPASNLAKATQVAIVTLPLTNIRSDPDKGCIFVFDNKNWSFFLDNLYKKIFEKEVTKLSARNALNAAKQKFSVSYTWASEYWKVVMKWEKKLIKAESSSNEEYSGAVVELYKDQFSRPYYKLNEDYEVFKQWASSVKLPEEVMKDVQRIVMRTGEELAEIYQHYPEYEEEDMEHHANFKTWISKLTSKGEAYYFTISALCEEKIQKHENCICYYMIYLSSLSCFEREFEQDTDKIKSVISRGLRLARDGCHSMMTRFLEHAFLVASKFMDLGDFCDYAKLAIKQYPLEAVENDRAVDLWFFCSRGILAGISNIIHEKRAATDLLTHYFHDVMKPVDPLEYFKNNKWPFKDVPHIYTQMRLLELLKFYVRFQRKVKTLTFRETMDIWSTYLKENKSNAIYAYSYLQFMNDQGCEKNGSVYWQAVKKEISNMSIQPNNYFERKCTLQTCYDALDCSLTFGSSNEQIFCSHQLSTMESAYGLKHNETYSLKSSTFFPLNEFTITFGPQPIMGSVSVTSFFSCLPEGLQSDSNTKDRPLCLFIHNLSYKATEKDIVEAFAAKKINLQGASIKRSSKGKSLGKGILHAASMDDKNKLLEEYKRFVILNRVCFIEEYEEENIQESLFEDPPEQPTVLYITGIPEEHYHPSNLQTIFSPYGHIKSLDLEDVKKPFSAKIEFHMHSDCKNALDQWLSGRLFPNTDVTMRISYASKKPKDKTSHTRKNKRQEGALFLRDAVSGPSRRVGHGKNQPHVPVKNQAQRMRSKLMLPRALMPRRAAVPVMRLAQQQKKVGKALSSRREVLLIPEQKQPNPSEGQASESAGQPSTKGQPSPKEGQQSTEEAKLSLKNDQPSPKGDQPTQKEGQPSPSNGLQSPREGLRSGRPSPRERLSSPREGLRSPRGRRPSPKEELPNPEEDPEEGEGSVKSKKQKTNEEFRQMFLGKKE